MEQAEILIAGLLVTVADLSVLAQIEALAGEERISYEKTERMRAFYKYGKRQFAARAMKIEDDGYEDRSLAYQQVHHLALRP